MRKDEPMRNINPFGLRLQPELKAQLEEAAKHNKRSLNAEISARLENSFAPADTPKLAFGIDRQKLLGGDDGQPPVDLAEEARHLSPDDLHRLLFEVISSSIDSALGKTDKRPAIPTKGPTPRGKHPAK
jgi:hypothetical protein